MTGGGGAKRAGVGWTQGSRAQSAGVIKVREPGDGHDDGRTEPKGPSHSGRSDAVQKGQTGHR